MAKAVFLHKPESIYPDILWERYVFPKMYLRTIEDCLGDWIVYFETAKALGGRGRRAYFALARLSTEPPVLREDDLYEVRITPGDYIGLPCPVPPVVDGRAIEPMLESAPGKIRKGGAITLAVRRLPEASFARIVTSGLGDSLDEGANLGKAANTLADPALPFDFERPVEEMLLRRKVRDRAFRQQVLDADPR